MSTAKEVEEFARRVERLCDFLLDKLPEGEDRDVLQKLKEEAADIQFNHSEVLEGLDKYMRGHDSKEQ